MSLAAQARLGDFLLSTLSPLFARGEWSQRDTSETRSRVSERMHELDGQNGSLYRET
jgi:hypothetical protein